MSDPQQNTWQRWRPQDLLAEADFMPVEMEIKVPEGGYASDELLQAELTRLRQQAEQKGYQKGLAQGIDVGKKQGYQDGLSQGRQEGIEKGLAESREQQKETVGRFNHMFHEFNDSLNNLDSVISSRLVQLALTAVRAILGKNSLLDNALLLEKIQLLLKQEKLFKGDTELWVNTGDFELVQENIGTTLASLGWTLRGDDNILPGGCRITSDEGELDATMDTRWNELCTLSREDYGL